MKVSPPERQNQITLSALLLELQLTNELAQLSSAISVYQELIAFCLQYAFLFKNEDSAPIGEVFSQKQERLSTPDPARDGANWLVYCAANPVGRWDPTGLNTRDDFAYQKRTEATSIIDYFVADKLEAQAAAENQGRSKTVFSSVVLTEECKSKNPLNHLKTLMSNYSLHQGGCKMPTLDYDGKVIKDLYKQKILERMFNFDNILCYVTSILDMYISDGVVTRGFMENQFEDILLKNMDKDNRLSADLFSRDIAKALGLSGYYNFVYKDGEMLLLSEDAFYLSEYKYGIGRFMKPSTSLSYKLRKVTSDMDIFKPKRKEYIPVKCIDHYGLFRNAPYRDYFNPGVADGIGNYVLDSIAPMKFISF